jgi:hypothetical protein
VTSCYVSKTSFFFKTQSIPFEQFRMWNMRTDTILYYAFIITVNKIPVLDQRRLNKILYWYEIYKIIEQQISKSPVCLPSKQMRDAADALGLTHCPSDCWKTYVISNSLQIKTSVFVLYNFSQDRAVSALTDYELDERYSIPDRGRDFFLRNDAQLSSSRNRRRPEPSKECVELYRHSHIHTYGG